MENYCDNSDNLYKDSNNETHDGQNLEFIISSVDKLINEVQQIEIKEEEEKKAFIFKQFLFYGHLIYNNFYCDSKKK